MTSELPTDAEPFLDTIDPKDLETREILQHLSKSKPYNAVMRIVLFTWPRTCREEVTKQLQDLRACRSDIAIEMSPFTLLLWKNLNVQYYYQYINRHKSYVRQCYELFDDLVASSVKQRMFSEGLLLDAYLPGEDLTPKQIDSHDDSKYSFVETVTYAMKWYPCESLGKCDEDSWEAGLQHHYCHNEHHPEHWGSKPMLWRYIVEAMYDMAAMELERRFKGHQPDNKAQLLVFELKFLDRFEKTGQLEFIRKLCSYTREAFCKHTGCQIPTEPNFGF